MTRYNEKYESLTIDEDARVSGMVTRRLTITDGTVRVSGMVAGELIVEGGDVRVSGAVPGTLVVHGGRVDITGQVRGLEIERGEVYIAVGASVRGRVLGHHGEWTKEGGTWVIESETPRFPASKVLNK